MKQKIKDVTTKLINGTITKDEADKILFDLFDVNISISDLDIYEASVGEDVDLLRAEGFIQGAKWLRKHIYCTH